MTLIPSSLWPQSIAFAVLLNLYTASAAAPAQAPNTPPPKEADLIHVLQSDAPPQEKAITCKRLAIYGSKEAVPALAPLLENESLASWARIALEAIPDPAADEALRSAVSKVQGRLLIGVINSIGVRHDARATSMLTEKLGDADSGVASAAAEALGHIGSPEAAKALEAGLANARPEVRSAVAYGCVLCAEQALANGQAADATRLYDQIRQASVPKQRILEATRGAILARGPAGLTLLLEQLRSADAGFTAIGLRAARELPGMEVTEALAKELDNAAPERQKPILLALADRNDAAVLPKLLQVAENGSTSLRTSAVTLLDRFRDLSCIPVLLKSATDQDPSLARAAKATLARLGGKDIDSDLLARLRLASGNMRPVLIDLVTYRRMVDALPLVQRSLEDSDPATRRAAVQAVGVLGSDSQAAELARLISASPTLEDREDLETALLTICGHNGARCLPAVLPLAQHGNSAARIIGLHALAAIGGDDALAGLKAAVQDPDPGVQDEAVRSLSNWPNTWPDDNAIAEPLLSLAKASTKPSHQVQATQGYLQYLQENKKLSNDEKLNKLSEVLPLLKTSDEKRLTVAVLGTIPTSGALERLIAFAEDRPVAEEACMAIVKIAADKNQKEPATDIRRRALQVVMDKSESDATRKKASDGLRRIN